MILHALKNWLFPKECLQCTSLLDSEEGFLCKGCAVHLELLEERVSSSHIACFDREGPGVSFLRALKSSQSQELMQICLSFMVIQLERMQRDPLDYITSIQDPMSYFLAKEMQKKLGMSCVHKKESIADKAVIIVGLEDPSHRQWEIKKSELFWGFPKRIDCISFLN